jgi:TonB-dependent SusC/RagA subfamily outer membrane receptor
MRLRLALFFILVGYISVSLKGHSQTVSLSGNNLPFKKAINSIKFQTGYVFFYDAKLLKDSKPVTVRLKNVTVLEALQQIFINQPFEWTIENKTIAFVKKSMAPAAAAVPQPEQDDGAKIDGTVKDQDGKPIEGASVLVMGTLKGTSSNADGSFSIDAHKGNVLVVSSVGYAEKQVGVNRNNIALHLELDVKPMERFIIGSNIMPIKRKAEVSSVGVIDRKTLESLPFQNIEQIYRGVVAGVNNIQSGYEVGQYSYFSGYVSIRGASTFSGYGTVNVYIDGIRFAGGSNYLNTLEKNNIDHIEVLKGPSSSTLYGSGGNGGVILVYTKKAKLNSTSIDLTTSAGWYDSKYQSEKPFGQFHSFNVAQGLKHFAFHLSGDLNNSETYMPGGKQKRYSLAGGVTYSKNNLKIILSGQHFENDYQPEREAIWDTSSHPFFNTPRYRATDSNDFVLESNVLSANVNYRMNKWWSHNLVAGWSYTMQDMASYEKDPTIARSMNKYRIPTIRYYNVISVAHTSYFKAALMTGVEYTDALESRLVVRKTGSTLSTFKVDTSELQKNTGIFAQFTPSYKDKLFITIAGRYEFNKTFGSVFNPRFGISSILTLGDLVLKPRIAWGRGITPPTWAIATAPAHNPNLRPQEQAGWDFGLEGNLFKGNLFFEIVHYNNILKDGINARPPARPGDPVQFVNAGKVNNQGWDFYANYRWKSLYISATYSIIDAIFKEPLSGESSPKDLVYPGEQMLFIARNTAGITAGHSFPKLFGHSDQLSLSANLAYTSGPYSIDRAKYVYEVLANRDNSGPNQYGPRYYKTKLPSSTRISFNLDYNILRDLRFFMQVYNLTNNTIPEYTNVYPAVGRGWMFGLKYHFTKTDPAKL